MKAFGSRRRRETLSLIAPDKKQADVNSPEVRHRRYLVRGAAAVAILIGLTYAFLPGGYSIPYNLRLARSLRPVFRQNNLVMGLLQANGKREIDFGLPQQDVKTTLIVDGDKCSCQLRTIGDDPVVVKVNPKCPVHGEKSDAHRLERIANALRRGRSMRKAG